MTLETTDRAAETRKRMTGHEDDAKTERKAALLLIFYRAAVSVRARPPELRGPWVISDEDLDAAIAVSARGLERYGVKP